MRFNLPWTHGLAFLPQKIQCKKADKVSPEALVTSENRHLLDLDTVGT